MCLRDVDTSKLAEGDNTEKFLVSNTDGELVFNTFIKMYVSKKLKDSQ